MARKAGRGRDRHHLRDRRLRRLPGPAHLRLVDGELRLDRPGALRLRRPVRRDAGRHLGLLPAPRSAPMATRGRLSATWSTPTAPTARSSARCGSRPGPAGGHRGRPRGTSRPTAAGCARRAGPAPTVLTCPGPAHHAAGTGATASSRRRPGTRRWTWSPAGVTPSAGPHGPDAVGVFGGGGLTNEKAYQLGKFARVALGTRHIDYNGRFCMSLGRGGRQPGVRHRPRAAVPGRGHRPAPGRCCCSAATSRTRCRRSCSTWRACGSAAGWSSSTRGVSATAALTADGAGLHLQPVPGTDLALLLGLLHVVVAEDRVDDGYLARAYDGWEDVRRSRLGVVAGPRGRRDRRARDGTARGGAHPRRRVAARGGPAPSCSPAAAPSSTPTAPTRSPPRSTWRSPSGCPGRAGVRLRLPHRPGQRAGRPRARAEVRPAARLPQHRGPGRPGARRRACGASTPETLPGKGVPAVELLGKLGDRGPRVLFVHGSNPVVSAPDATAVRRRLEALDLLVVCDFVPSETAELADVVLPVTQWAEEEGTMTSLEGRVLRRRRAVAAPPARCAASSTCWPTSRRGSAARRRSSTEPACGLRRARLGPAPAVAPTTAGIDYDRARRGRGAALAVPDARPRRHAAAVRWTRFATATGGAAMVAGAARPVRPTTCAPTRRVYLVTGRVLAHYQSGAQTRRVRSPEPRPRPGRSSRCTRSSRAARASRTATTSRVTSSRGAADGARADQPRHPAGHGVHAVPLGRRRARPTRSPTTRPTRSPGCRSSRCARSRSRAPTTRGECAHEPVSRSSWSAPAWSATASSTSWSRRDRGRPVRRPPGRRGGVRAVQPDPAHRRARRARATWRRWRCRSRDERVAFATGYAAPSASTASRRLVELDDGAAARGTTTSCSRPAPARSCRRCAGLADGLPRHAHVLRTIDDCRDLAARALNARHAVVLGGGAARARGGLRPGPARGRGSRWCTSRTTWRRPSSTPPRRASLAATLGDLGIDVRTGDRRRRGGRRGTASCSRCASPTARRSPPTCCWSRAGSARAPSWPRDRRARRRHGVVVGADLHSPDGPAGARDRRLRRATRGRHRAGRRPAGRRPTRLAALLTGTPEPPPRARRGRHAVRLKAAGVDLVTMGVRAAEAVPDRPCRHRRRPRRPPARRGLGPRRPARRRHLRRRARARGVARGRLRPRDAAAQRTRWRCCCRERAEEDGSPALMPGATPRSAAATA